MAGRKAAAGGRSARPLPGPGGRGCGPGRREGLATPARGLGSPAPRSGEVVQPTFCVRRMAFAAETPRHLSAGGP